MTTSAELLLRPIDFAMQSGAIFNLFGDRCMTLQAGLRQLRDSCSAREVRRTGAMTGDTVAPAIKFRNLRVHRSHRPRPCVTQV